MSLHRLVSQTLRAAVKGYEPDGDELARLPDPVADEVRSAVARVAGMAAADDPIGAYTEAKRSIIEVLEFADAERYPANTPLRPVADDDQLPSDASVDELVRAIRPPLL